MSAIDYRALGRKGGLTSVVRHGGRAMAARARAASPTEVSYFYRFVDPDGTLAVSDRAERARALQRIYFTDLAKRSAAARRKRAVNGGGP
jgi:hypothetical protein